MTTRRPSQHDSPATVAVAFSGGRDSLALLHATAQAARDMALEVVALHVHHGLLPEADAWVASAQALVARWRRRGLPLRLRWCRLDGQPARGDSVEAWARRERYAALVRMAREEGVGLVLLAQHRRDQAETVLLQALRGAGPRGLAAMPVELRRDGVTFLRPWLDRPREAIEAYVRRHRLRPLEDPSNDDPRWARNRLRLAVWPTLLAAFPQAEAALAGAARRAQEAAEALAELAALDLENCGDTGGALNVAAWLSLSPARRANALRHWLAPQAPRGVPQTLLQRLLDELPTRRQARWPLDDDRQCLLYRGTLRVAAVSRAAGPVLRLDLSQPGRVDVPGWGGAFEIQAVTEHGLPAAALREVELRPRQGGEQFQRGPKTPARALKKQFQTAGLADAERGGPLVWRGAQLLFVPGLGIDARALAPAGAAQLSLRWLPAVSGS